MMKRRILFLASIFDVISLRRAAAIARKMSSGYSPEILDLTSSMRERLESFMDEEKLFLPIVPLHPPPSAPTRKNLPLGRVDVRRDESSLDRIVELAGVDDAAWMEELFEKYRTLFRMHLDAARMHLHRQRPNLVVYYQEFDVPSRAFLLACRECGVPILSMQHGEGYLEQYSALPLFATHHFAFSAYNVDVLLKMGAARDRIFEVGFPESDVEIEIDRGSLRREWRDRYGIAEHAHVILAALRPHYVPSYARNNTMMLSNLARHLPKDGVELLVKPHPSDSAVGKAGLVRELTDRYSTAKLMHEEEPIGPAMAAADSLVTFFSSTLGEAVEKGISIFAIEEDPTERWPPWKKYDVLEVIGINDFPSSAERICAGASAPRKASRDDARRRFMEYFRGPRDGRAAERMAAAIEAITAVSCVTA